MLIDLLAYLGHIKCWSLIIKMSFCSCNKTKQIGNKLETGKSIEKQWNPYCMCELQKCPGVKKSETGIQAINHIN